MARQRFIKVSSNWSSGYENTCRANTQSLRSAFNATINLGQAHHGIDSFQGASAYAISGWARSDTQTECLITDRVSFTSILTLLQDFDICAIELRYPEGPVVEFRTAYIY